MIEVQAREEASLIRLAHGKASALDLEFATVLAEALREAARSEQPIILTGTRSIFSAGVDLFRILDESPSYVVSFLQSLDELLLTAWKLEVPMVAAINGHAIAGGLILALCCDWRLIAAGGGRAGVPELRVGVPFPRLPLEIVRARVPVEHFEMIMFGGETFEAQRALDLGLVDELVEPAKLIDRAAELCRSLSSIPGEAFAITKRNIRSVALERFERRGSDVDEKTLKIWSSASTRAAIRGYLDRTIGKR